VRCSVLHRYRVAECCCVREARVYTRRGTIATLLCCSVATLLCCSVATLSCCRGLLCEEDACAHLRRHQCDTIVLQCRRYRVAVCCSVAALSCCSALQQHNTTVSQCVAVPQHSCGVGRVFHFGFSVVQHSPFRQDVEFFQQTIDAANTERDLR